MNIKIPTEDRSGLEIEFYRWFVQRVVGLHEDAPGFDEKVQEHLDLFEKMGSSFLRFREAFLEGHVIVVQHLSEGKFQVVISREK
jgi:hypothetical protein